MDLTATERRELREDEADHTASHQAEGNIVCGPGCPWWSCHYCGENGHYSSECPR